MPKNDVSDRAEAAERESRIYRRALQLLIIGRFIARETAELAVKEAIALVDALDDVQIRRMSH